MELPPPLPMTCHRSYHHISLRGLSQPLGRAQSDTELGDRHIIGAPSVPCSPALSSPYHRQETSHHAWTASGCREPELATP